MSVDYSVSIIVGAELEISKIEHKKEVTRYNERTGEPYTKLEFSHHSYVVNGKEMTEQEYCDFSDAIDNSKLVERHFGYDITVVGELINDVECNCCVEINESELGDSFDRVKEGFRELGLPDNTVKVVVLFSCY